MRGELSISWDSSIATVVVEGWRADTSRKIITGSYSASEDVMEQDSAFTVQCTLASGTRPASDPDSGWTLAAGVWTLDPYVRLKRRSFKVSQTV